MKNKLKILILLLLILLAVFLRFYKLGEIPAGFHVDAVSQSYNAFSLITTGKDRYAESFPILFRSNGSYQPPLYTYLTIIPVLILGNTIFAAHFISALSGSLLVIITILFSYFAFDKLKQRFLFIIIATLTIAISPWAIFFSRLVVEANLAVTIFAVSLLFFTLSLKKPSSFIIACLFLGISTHAYYSERLISVIFLPLFLLIFKKHFIRKKKMVLLGILVFLIIQIPHLLILNSGAFARRFDQVGYAGDSGNISSGNYYFLQISNIVKSFINNYLTYYSPKNLFFDSDSEIGRAMPGLSVFYTWFLIPFIFGLKYLFKNLSNNINKIILLLLVITPIPAGLTGDIFYPLRTLDFLYVLSIIISLGIYQIYQSIKSNLVKKLSFVLFLYLLFSLFISYFVLFKYEKSDSYGYPYLKLIDKLEGYKNMHVVVDSARDTGIGLRIAYLRKYPAEKMQQQLRVQLESNYYSSIVNNNERYIIDNIEVKPINWGDSCRDNLLIVGDVLSVSDKNEAEHKLTREFEIRDLSGKISLVGYLTNPKDKCKKENIIY